MSETRSIRGDWRTCGATRTRDVCGAVRGPPTCVRGGGCRSGDDSQRGLVRLREAVEDHRLDRHLVQLPARVSLRREHVGDPAAHLDDVGV
eukprot:5131691-Prymnesium_polylepis.1